MAETQKADAARYILANLSKLGRDAAKIGPLLQHAARFAPESELPALARFVRERFANDTGFQLGLFNSVELGLRQRGIALPETIRDWGQSLVNAVLNTADGSGGWLNIPIENAPTANPWDFQERAFSNGARRPVLSSFPHGEPLTGVLRSPIFAAPARLSFWLCGHDGPPDRPPQRKNLSASLPSTQAKCSRAANRRVMMLHKKSPGIWPHIWGSAPISKLSTEILEPHMHGWQWLISQVGSRCRAFRPGSRRIEL